MPKFLAGCHENEEEIRRHLKLFYRILAGPNEWQQVCNRSNPGKTGRSCEGADFSWLSSKVSRTVLWVVCIFFWFEMQLTSATLVSVSRRCADRIKELMWLECNFLLLLSLGYIHTGSA